MRWIQGKNRGLDLPPDGDVCFVDEKGSMALVNSRLYIDGKLAPDGKHTVKLKETDLEVTVKNGKAKRGQEKWRGMDV